MGFNRLRSSLQYWEQKGDNEMITSVLQDMYSVDMIHSNYFETMDVNQLRKSMWRLDTYVRETFHEVLTALEE